MLLNREHLVETLRIASAGLGTGSLIPMFQHFMFRESRVLSTDGKVFVEVGMDIGVNCSVREEVFTLLSSLSEEEIQLEVRGERLFIETDKVVGEFEILPEKESVEFPAVPPNAHWYLVKPSLIRGLEFCRKVVAEDVTMPDICGVRFEGGFTYSTDRYRAMRVTQEFEDIPLQQVPIVIPSRMVDILLKNKESLKEYTLTETHIFFRTEELVIFGSTLQKWQDRSLQGFFPKNVSEMLHVDLSRLELVKALDRHIKFQGVVEEMDKRVSVLLQPGICILTTVAQGVGKLVEKLTFEGTLPEGVEKVGFAVNPISLKDILGICNDFYFCEKTNMIYFIGEGVEFVVGAAKTNL